MNTDKLHRVRLVKSLPAKSRIVGLLQVCRRIALGLAVFSLALVLLGPAWAGSGALDTSFNPGAGVKSIPFLWGRTDYTDHSGKMLIAGNFKQMGGFDRRGIARINADGSLDESFDAKIEAGAFGAGYINNWVLLDPGVPDSKIIIAGDFIAQSSTGPYYGLARLNGDGTVDPTFTHTLTSSDGIQGLVRQQSNGKLIICGYGMTVTGDPGKSYYLLRLDADGKVLDDNFKRSGVGGYVYGVWSYKSTDTFPNQVRLFGTIPRWSDPTHTHVDHMMRLDVDGTSVLESIGDEIVNGPIHFLTYQGSNLVIVGAFTKVFNTPMNNIARFSASGTSLDPNFKIGTGANGHVKRVNNDGDGLVLNGYFNDFNGKACGYMVRLNNDGSMDNTFNNNIGTAADDRIWNVFKDYNPDGSWANTWTVTGAFQSFKGQPRQCLASLDSTGNLRTQFNTFSTGYEPSNPVVHNLQFAPGGGGLFVWGDFSGYGGKLHRRGARVNYSNGSVDGSFRAGMGGTVYTADVDWQVSKKVLVGGHFFIGTGYVRCTSLARLNTDGSKDLDFDPLLAKADGTIPDIYLAQHSWDGSGHILVGGDFTSVNGVNRSGIVRLNSNGTLDTGFTFDPASMPGLSNIVVTQTDDDMGGPVNVVGKAIYQGSPCGFMARLLHDGKLDTSFGNGPSPVPHVVIFNGEVKGGRGDDMNGVITLAGTFTKILDGANNPDRNYLARFSRDGIMDNTFNPTGPNGPIYAMDGQWPTDKIIIGGDFTAVGAVGRNHIARLKGDGSLDLSFDPGTGTDAPVYAIMYDSQARKAVIGGTFTTYNGVPRSRIAKISMGSGGLSGIELLLFE
jgi:uncharacterized delta-60 repeat protein